MINKIKNEKGITLVALAITIVVMTILIVVTVKVSTDEEILKTAEDAANDYEESIVFEAMKTILVSERSLYEDGFVAEDTMWDNIKKSIEGNDELSGYGTVNVIDKEGYLEVTVGEMKYKITMDKVEKI